MNRIELFRGDITKLKVDAIVNAANTTLLGGGGVDGAIHRAAGKNLLAECRKLNVCQTGDAKITKGYNLPAKYVIHTVGPVWHGGNSGERKKLASCYRRSLEVASENEVKTIAFSNISTGVYGYPKTEAAEVALAEVNQFLKNHSEIDRVIFCFFDEENFEIYRRYVSNEKQPII
jgi:O-acetyl-ADP-ribose deacetylase (regulator of RNase III)